MTGQIRDSLLTKILWGLMGLFLLNISVDAIDPNPKHVPEDLTINDQESIIEMVVEKILGFEDIIAECDDNDTEDHNNTSNVQIDLITLYTVNSGINQLINETIKQQFSDYATYLTNDFQTLDTLPPKI